MMSVRSFANSDYSDDVAHLSSPRPIRIGSFLGGGARGIIPAYVCQELEKNSKYPICEFFDIVAGASVGAMVATSLLIPSKEDPTKPANTAEKVYNMFKQDIPKIFPHTEWYKKPLELRWPEYNRDILHSILVQNYGETHNSDLLKEILVPAGETTTGKPWWFTRTQIITDPRYSIISSEDAKKILTSDLIEATAAAPSYYKDKEIVIGGKSYHFIDGGTFANNPIRRALSYAEKLYGTNRPEIAVSFGTGETRSGIPGPHNCEGGIIYWGENFINASLNMTSDDVENEMRCLFSDDPNRDLFVFQPVLADADASIDDSSEAHMQRLEASAQKMVEDQSDDINRLCEKVIIEHEPI